jgi:hypothetical protein
LRIPALIIAGEKYDQDSQARQPRAWCLLPKAEQAIIPNAGSVRHARTQAFNEAVLKLFC